MNATNLNIRRIDSRRDDIRAAMAELRAGSARRETSSAKPAGSGRSRSSASRFRPQQVVERICRDVQEKGLAAVLDYSARIDKAPLTAETLRVPAAELAKAHAAADPQLLEAVRRVAAEHPRVSAGDSAPRRAAGAARRVSGRSGIGRWIGWGFACRAGPPRIRRPC